MGFHCTSDASPPGLLVPGDDLAFQSTMGPGRCMKARPSSCFDLVDFGFLEGDGSHVLKSLYHALGRASHEAISLFPIIIKTVIRDLKEVGPLGIGSFVKEMDELVILAKRISDLEDLTEP
ncbi:hypothetical protein AMTR_s00150p00078970 [Amborella trichopoda]|uniref:Uncharacterized protein n=1 Tax=Amborella trichopoda TaxID=13333 RepID=W1PKA5_AMBTC|nr:hypothetical protein AMTR_s00150p00078970 [Amborella trichopoda]